MKKICVVIVAVLVAAGGALFYASPFFALWNIKSSVENQDAQGLAAAVDFPAIRESLKKQASSKATQATSAALGGLAVLDKIGSLGNLGKLGDKLGKIGAARKPLVAASGVFAEGLTAPVIDKTITPEGILTLAETHGIFQPDDDDESGSGGAGDDSQEYARESHHWEIDMDYESLHRVIIAVEYNDRPASLVLTREGAFDAWRIVDVVIKDYF